MTDDDDPHRSRSIDLLDLVRPRQEPDIDDANDQVLVILGPSMSGKTAALTRLVRRRKGRIVVIDPDGDLATSLLGPTTVTWRIGPTTTIRPDRFTLVNRSLDDVIDDVIAALPLLIGRPLTEAEADAVRRLLWRQPPSGPTLRFLATFATAAEATSELRSVAEGLRHEPAIIRMLLDDAIAIDPMTAAETIVIRPDRIGDRRADPIIVDLALLAAHAAVGSGDAYLVVDAVDRLMLPAPDLLDERFGLFLRRLRRRRIDIAMAATRLVVPTPTATVTLRFPIVADRVVLLDGYPAYRAEMMALLGARRFGNERDDRRSS
jgi:hypothetical protein